MIEKKIEQYLREKLANSAVVSEEDQKRLLEEKIKTGKRFVEILPRFERPIRFELLRIIAEYHQIPFLQEKDLEGLDRNIFKLIPEKLIRYFKVLPVKKEKDVLMVAMIDPQDVVLVDRLAQYAKCEIKPVFAMEDAIAKATEKYLGSDDQLKKAIKKIEGDDQNVNVVDSSEAGTGNAPAVNLVNLIIEKAIENRASDIHLEPAESNFYVRYRVDGVLYDYSPLPPKNMEASIISRLKIMANLDIAEKRLPQDGRIQFRTRSKEVNLRISTFPTINGENVVIRVLDRSDSLITLQDLGLDDSNLVEFEKIIQKPYGIILVTGPTGSGKTTTLYSALNQINSIEKHIITLEDPVEYRLDRVRQSQIDTKSGLTFARGLRSIMRQDPDVIMVGEIRDLETASIAIQAALTGHLVLSTLHTNDAPSAITRLVDMGVEPFLISSSLALVIAQRLVRKLCLQCRRPYVPERALLAEVSGHVGNKNLKSEYYELVGCEACKNTGYQGRMGIFEFMLPYFVFFKPIVNTLLKRPINKHHLCRLCGNDTQQSINVVKIKIEIIR